MKKTCSERYQSPLGKSDHKVLQFDFNCYTVLKHIIRAKICYDKADFQSINREIQDITWDELINPENDMDTNWQNFHSTIKKIEAKYIPTKTSKISLKKHSNFPMDKETLVKIKKKNSLSRKAIKTKDPAVRKEYNRIRNQVKKSVDNLKKQFEKNLSSSAKENPKAIWRYIKSRSKTRTGIGDLNTEPDNPSSVKTDNDKEKADILANVYPPTPSAIVDSINNSPASIKPLVLVSSYKLTCTSERNPSTPS